MPPPLPPQPPELRPQVPQPLRIGEPKPRGRYREMKWGLGIAGGVLLMAMVIGQQRPSETPPPTVVAAAPKQTRPTRDPNTGYVWVATKREVKSRLKYPDSAEFPGVLEYPDHVRRQADGTYLVTGWVKAMTPLGMKQMTFAATLREVMPQRFAATEVVINE